MERPRDTGSTTQFGKRAAAVVMILMAFLAAMARDVTLWGLIELKMELLIQCVPVFLVALHWRDFRALPAFVGLVLGTCVVLVGVFAGVKRIEGMHIGVIALGANLLVACVGSLPCVARKFSGGRSHALR